MEGAKAVSNLLRALVLSEISDDYEHFEHIAQTLMEFAGRSGLVVTRSQVLAALVELVNEGFAKGYRLSATAPVEELRGVPTQEAANDPFCYFLATQGGREFNSSSEDLCDGQGRLSWLPEH